MAEQVKYGSVSAWAKELNIPVSTLRKRLKYVPYIEGRIDRNSRLARTYSEEDVIKACKGLVR